MCVFSLGGSPGSGVIIWCLGDLGVSSRGARYLLFTVYFCGVNIL